MDEEGRHADIVRGYRYFDMRSSTAVHRIGVMGNPPGAACKGEIAFSRFANHLIDAVHEFESRRQVRSADWTAGKTMGGTA
jgi:hypothetical protein